MQDRAGKLDLDAVAGAAASRARDVVYVAVGLGVLGLQRAQARRHGVAARGVRSAGDEGLERVRRGVATASRQVAGWTGTTTEMLGAALAPLEAKLPPPGREAASTVRSLARVVGAQLRHLGSSGG